jgi:hypothetical protein
MAIVTHESLRNNSGFQVFPRFRALHLATQDAAVICALLLVGLGILFYR